MALKDIKPADLSALFIPQELQDLIEAYVEGELKVPRAENCTTCTFALLGYREFLTKFNKSGKEFQRIEYAQWPIVVVSLIKKEMGPNGFRVLYRENTDDDGRTIWITINWTPIPTK